MADAWMALPAGILIASAVSAIGIGGGVFWMPLLLLVYGHHPPTAVVTSLVIQTAGMGSGTVAYLRQGYVDLRLALLLVIALPGLAVGAIVAHRLNPIHVELILGALVLVTAFLFVSYPQRYDDLGRDRADVRQAVRSLWFVGGMAVASGMLSVSLGEWLVPMMRTRLSMRMSRAVGTSIFITLGTCCLATLIHLGLGARIDWGLAAWAIPGVVLGGQIGPRLARRVNERTLKEVFIFLLTLIGIHLIYNAY
jgi:uncharacterized membrane protein YfcA